MTKSIEKVATLLVKWLMPFCLMTFIPLLSSCEEDDDDDGDSEAEFENWQERNDKTIAEWAADPSLTKVRNYALNKEATAGNSDYIYVKVLEEGHGIGTPMLTDTVRIAYRGRLIPSKTYPEGFVFDQSYLNEFAWETAYPAQGASWIVGMQTALLEMNVGDRWLIHIPYQLAYGSSSGSTTIPAYSNLIFDVALFDFWRPGDSRPPFKTR
jgi:FKBP-type peptidyl-prolyl cis-trans isomerase FklB